MNTPKQIIQLLALNDRHFADYHSPDIARLSEAEEAKLVQLTLAALNENNKQAKRIELLKQADSKSVCADIAVFVAVTFLLRTHIKMQRDNEGKWMFLLEHTPGDSDALKAVLTHLQSLWSKKTG